MLIKQDKPSYNVGDTVKIYAEVLNTGNVTGEGVIATLSVPELKFISDGGFNVTQLPYELYQITFGSIEPNDYRTAVLTFLATKAGQITVNAYASGDNYFDTDGNRDSTVITIVDGNETSTTPTTVSAGNIVQSLPATGNALLLLGLALCSFIPFYRRD